MFICDLYIKRLQFEAARAAQQENIERIVSVAAS